MLGLTLLVASCLMSSAAIAAVPPGGSGKKIHHTYPQPPGPTPANPLRVAPGFEVPEHPEYYTWKVTNKTSYGKVVYQGAVPLYTLNGRASVSGELAVGTEVKLVFFRKLGANLYYAVPAPGSDPAKPVEDPDSMLWINGLYLEPAAFNPPKMR